MIAAALLVLSVAAALAATWVDRAHADAGRLLNDPATTVSELLCFGVVGAVLIARRPDLPFGWYLGAGAIADVVLVGVGVPSLALAYDAKGGQLAAWGIGLGVLQWVPTAVEGLVNVRFPSGRPAGRLGGAADLTLRIGIPVGLVGNYLGDTVFTDTDQLGRPTPVDRFIDGTWITSAANATLVLIPLLILVGIVAGIGIVVRCFAATGIERRQLQWRAGGVVISLLLFPLAVSGYGFHAVSALEPAVFVTSLVIPVLRYQLWTGDPRPRRRMRAPLVTRRTLIEAREEERRRLRRDLHDGLGPLLTGLRLNLDAAQAQLGQDPDKVRAHLASARETSAEAISDLRGLVYGLRPPALDELGLSGALRAASSAMVEQSGVSLTLDVEADLELAAAVEVAIYRAVVEAMTNVVRHSTATSCRVSIARRGSEVVLTVVDDGRVSHTWYPGVGLTSMRERALELGGTATASSGPTGFEIMASYPAEDVR